MSPIPVISTAGIPEPAATQIQSLWMQVRTSLGSGGILPGNPTAGTGPVSPADATAPGFGGSNADGAQATTDANNTAATAVESITSLVSSMVNSAVEVSAQTRAKCAEIAGKINGIITANRSLLANNPEIQQQVINEIRALLVEAVRAVSETAQKHTEAGRTITSLVTNPWDGNRLMMEFTTPGGSQKVRTSADGKTLIITEPDGSTTEVIRPTSQPAPIVTAAKYTSPDGRTVEISPSGITVRKPDGSTEQIPADLTQLSTVLAASSLIGTPYAWGGGHQQGAPGTSTPPSLPEPDSQKYRDFTINGVDCSGLARAAYAYGVGTPIGQAGDTSTVGMWDSPGAAKPVWTAPPTADAAASAAAAQQAKPGDLLFFGTSPTASATNHVSVYLGNGLMIEAPASGSVARIAPIKPGMVGIYGMR